ncbi:MAG: hypothetical protein LKF42_09755 [Streptococcaceae bacterium]|jgi:hypothetical protein|nr:hypothetical protein [Streptococcaceae bacterium]
MDDQERNVEITNPFYFGFMFAFGFFVFSLMVSFVSLIIWYIVANLILQ